jgi:CBS domain containing-hemolysin-like protein
LQNARDGRPIGAPVSIIHVRRPFQYRITLSAGTITFRLAMVLLLVAANAFFVAAEFALVAVRRSRIDQLAAEGNRSAAVVQQRPRLELDRYISGTQLGITLASLALGWIGEPAIAVLVDMGLNAVGVPLPSGVVHSGAGNHRGVHGGHVPAHRLRRADAQVGGAHSPGGVSLWVTRPLIVFSNVMSPFIALLQGTANRLLRLLGVEPASEGAHVHSPEELRLLVMQARAHGTLDESDSAMLAGVFDFHNKKAWDVMRPRTDVAAIPEDADEATLRQILKTERYSRYPVYRETLDDIVGVLLAKDFWLSDDDTPFELRAHLREPLFVPATRAAERVLEDLRRTRAHLAVVLDEYGGTAGIVTLEDLVEEVVGDIADEYDQVDREAMVTDGVLELAGALSLVDVRSDYKLAIPDGDWTTLGGYAFSALGRLPTLGDRVSYPGGELEVVAMDGRRVAALRVLTRPEAAP